MQFRTTISVLLILCAAGAIAGCTGVRTPTGSPTPAAGTAGTTVPAEAGLVTAPTDVVPEYNAVAVDVGEKDYLGMIPVIFQGGTGQIHVKRVEVTLTRADGLVKTATLGASKGDEVELEGTKQTDRVVVIVFMDNGQSYRIADVLSPYRTRG